MTARENELKVRPVDYDSDHHTNSCLSSSCKVPCTLQTLPPIFPMTLKVIVSIIFQTGKLKFREVRNLSEVTQ